MDGSKTWTTVSTILLARWCTNPDAIWQTMLQFVSRPLTDTKHAVLQAFKKTFSTQLTVSVDVRENGLDGLKNTTSTWMNKTIDAPVLDISAYYLGERYRYLVSESNLTDGIAKFNNISRVTWVRSNNKTYDLSYIEQNGSCQGTSAGLTQIATYYC